jgi:hypothetical protein
MRSGGWSNKRSLVRNGRKNAARKQRPRRNRWLVRSSIASAMRRSPPTNGKSESAGSQRAPVSFGICAATSPSRRADDSRQHTQPLVRDAIRRNTLVHHSIVRRPPHSRRFVWLLVVGRIITGVSGIAFALAAWPGRTVSRWRQVHRRNPSRRPELSVRQPVRPQREQDRRPCAKGSHGAAFRRMMRRWHQRPVGQSHRSGYLPATGAAQPPNRTLRPARATLLVSLMLAMKLPSGVVVKVKSRLPKS